MLTQADKVLLAIGVALIIAGIVECVRIARG